ncbi:hypothetical protein [Streptomyces sp. NPDC059072]|uniref:hypothetical protein n=1 Tax=Streptomyces sp. NPDC059072 TaxID=3346715 RepID=UPI0036753F72
MTGFGGGQMLGDLAGLVRAQRYRAADRAQPARLVVAAEEQELRAGQGAGDRADDRLGAVASSLVKARYLQRAQFRDIGTCTCHN